jgi:hypothetical protein
VKDFEKANALNEKANLSLIKFIEQESDVNKHVSGNVSMPKKSD